MPRFWLTGRLFYGGCGHSMQSTHGASKADARHYYYGCGNPLKRLGCEKSNVHKDEIENILSIMVEVLSTQCEFFTISGKKYPADLVHQRFSEINSGHIEYVLECLHKCGSDIRNIKQYLIAALFNAPATYSSYYSAAVRRDCAWLQC